MTTELRYGNPIWSDGHGEHSSGSIVRFRLLLNERAFPMAAPVHKSPFPRPADNPAFVKHAFNRARMWRDQYDADHQQENEIESRYNEIVAGALNEEEFEELHRQFIARSNDPELEHLAQVDPRVDDPWPLASWADRVWNHATERFLANRKAWVRAQLSPAERVAVLEAQLPKVNRPEVGATGYVNGHPVTVPAKRPSQYRPEREHLVARQSVGSLYTLAVVEDPEHEWVHIDADGNRRVTVSPAYFITMAEDIAKPARTRDDLARLNTHYLGTEVPLKYTPKGGTWTVLEPFGSVSSPFTRCEDAEQEMSRWAQEARDDLDQD